jgi:hypothetical protein
VERRIRESDEEDTRMGSIAEQRGGGSAMKPYPTSEEKDDDELLPGYQKVKTDKIIHTDLGLQTVSTDEYDNVVSRHADIINEVAQKYVNLKDKYELYMYTDVEVHNEGLPNEYVVIYWKIVLEDKKTKEDETVGYIEYADNCLSTLTPEEQENGYIIVYPDTYIREQAEEIFQDWIKEEEDDEDD